MSILRSSFQNEEDPLIKAAAIGNLDAFNQLVLMYQDMAYHHALAMLDDTYQAEDATQESFIKAFQNISSFRGGSFRSWLMRIVTNTVYDMLRKSRRYPTQPLFPKDEDGEEIESAPWLADPSPSIHDTVEKRELSGELYTILDKLPEAYRSVLTLIDIFELDYTEAARSLNIPIGTVKSRIARARLQMKEKIKSGRIHSNHHVSTPINIAALIESN